MKIIDISERGIKILEDGEIINQGLFEEEEDIPQEIKELLSIYENIDTVILNIHMDIKEEIKNEIKIIIKDCGWKIKENKNLNLSKKTKIFIIIIFICELIFSGIIFIKKFQIEKGNRNLKSEIISYKKSVSQINESLEVYREPDEVKVIFKKVEITKYLIYLSEICRKYNIYLEKIEFKENKIFVNGYSNKIENIFNLKTYALADSQLLESKFDYIKKEGEVLYFLMELEID